jgi:hypothetical protein
MDFTNEQIEKIRNKFPNFKGSHNRLNETFEEIDYSKKKLEISKNIVQFRNGFINLKDSGVDNSEIAMSVISELMNLGYTVDDKAFNNLSKASKEDIISFHNEVLNYIKIMIGADNNYTPFWPNFPESVMNKSEVELWLHQIIHYMSNGEYIPNELTREKGEAFNKGSYTILTYGDDKMFLQIFTELVSVNGSLTPDDKDIVEWFVVSEQKLNLPKEIPFKENVCLLASLGVDCNLKTVTDILRVASYMSNSGINLGKSEITIFKKFSRTERKFILSLLEKTNCDISEGVLRLEKWIRLGEILHPGDYKNKFPKSLNFFNKLRNEKVTSWFSKLNTAFNSNFEEGLKMLSERPGEFFRRIDSLIRNNVDKKEIILNYIQNIGTKVSNKVLFETYEHFEKRKSKNEFRSIMIKGNRNVISLPILEPLNDEIVKEIQLNIKKSLIKKFKELPDLTNVWLDEDLKKIPMPKNMRSLSSSLSPIIRGERIPIKNKDAKVIRTFVHWYDEYGNQDLDLSAIFIGEDKIETIGWNSYHNSILGCYSGDIRHRIGACAEYVDIKLDKAISNGFKYVVMDVRSFNGKPFHSLSQCVFGYMEVENAIEDKNFIPKTLENTIRLQSDSTGVIMCVLDLKTKEYITLDVDSKGFVATQSLNDISNSIREYCEPPSFSVYDLLIMHIEARNGNITIEEEAETKFNYEDFANSYLETLKFMGI